jgi:hypothetical protein
MAASQMPLLAAVVSARRVSSTLLQSAASNRCGTSRWADAASVKWVIPSVRGDRERCRRYLRAETCLIGSGRSPHLLSRTVLNVEPRPRQCSDADVVFCTVLSVLTAGSEVPWAGSRDKWESRSQKKRERRYPPASLL